MEHDRDALAKVPADARLYLRPVGLVDGPFADPAAAQQLAGGTTWFSGVQLIVRYGPHRLVSLVVPVAELRRGSVASLPSAFSARLAVLWQALTQPRPALMLGDAALTMTRPQIMAVLNVTPDSFSDGGRYRDGTAALAEAEALAQAGAAIIDVGAESTRPGAETVPDADEIARLEPLLKAWHSGLPPLSVDTRKGAAMRHALARGARMINDVAALTFDAEALEVAVRASVPVVVMHAQGAPATMQLDPRYDDVALDVYDWLEARISALVAAGIDRRRLIVDPGIGFGKTLRHNLDLMNQLSLFHGLGCPLLVGASRKRFIGALTRQDVPAERVAGSVAAALHAAGQGVQLLRVHDVAPTREALALWQGLRDAGMSPPADMR